MAKLSLAGYVVAREPILASGGLTPKVGFTCGGCNLDIIAALAKGIDNNAHAYPVMRCPNCRQVNAVRRPTGDFLAWRSRAQVIEDLREGVTR